MSRFIVVFSLFMLSISAHFSALGEEKKYATATLAAGCFWCIEADLEKLDGIIEVTSGYTGGSTTSPTYKDVSAGKTGHTEAVQVVFDPKVITYPALLGTYWKNVDALDIDGQFCDRGTQYRPGIFYHNDSQKQAALTSRDKASQQLGQAITLEITEASSFYPAETYHQDYYKKNPLRYRFYRFNCGRDKRLKELWK